MGGEHAAGPQYFCGRGRKWKGTNINAHSPERLLEVATELNQRPRETLGGIMPVAALEKLLLDPPKPTVATTL